MPPISDVTRHLLIINVILYLAGFVMDTHMLALYFPMYNGFQPFQILTHMFMHGGFIHLFFNMFALVSFGSLLETVWGPKRFMIFYFICGLGAMLLQLSVTYFEIHKALDAVAHLNLSKETIGQILNVKFDDHHQFRGDLFSKEIMPILQNLGIDKNVSQADFNSLFGAAATAQQSMVGASGAIYGLLAAFAILFPEAPIALMFIPIPMKAKYIVPLFIILEFILGKGSFSGDNVAHFAHIGGALTGLIILLIWRKQGLGNNRGRWN